MRLIRCVLSNGQVVSGIESISGFVDPLPAGTPLFFTPERTVTERREIHKRLAPFPVSQIFCIGKNYADHVLEMAGEKTPKMPEFPVVFMKPTTAVCGSEEDILIPLCAQQAPEVDYEGELVAVIGRECKNVSVEKALDFVWGYTIANDVSARRWQKEKGGGQWIRGKGFDRFCPMGPALVSRDEVGDPQALRLQTRVNGSTRQNSSTGEMLFSIAHLISFLSEDTTLLPGTALLTGTPPGVGAGQKPPLFLKPGDDVEIEISKIGILKNSVANAECPL